MCRSDSSADRPILFNADRDVREGLCPFANLPVKLIAKYQLVTQCYLQPGKATKNVALARRDLVDRNGGHIRLGIVNLSFNGYCAVRSWPTRIGLRLYLIIKDA